jgi:PPM family protein phosphatase
MDTPVRRGTPTVPLRPPVAPGAGAEAVPWFAAALRTDRGQARDDNQDAVYGITALLPRTSPEGVPVAFGFFAVADGMGGLADGALASTGAIRTVAEHIVTALLTPALGGPQRAAEQGTVADILRAGMTTANAAIHRQAKRNNAPSGTTFSGAVLLGRQLIVGHVGDSRIYLFGPEGLRRLTTDHSMVGRLIEMGHMQPEDVYNNPQRNALYRTLGLTPQVEIETASLGWGQATHLLLCSDGLWDVVGEPAMTAALREEATIEAAADRLVAEANSLGGPDNISAIVVRLP